MAANLIGGLITGGISLAKGITGAFQAAKGKKQLNNLLANRPTYNIPDAYQKALGLAQQMASQEMPGLSQYKDTYAQGTARAISGLERGAISSNAYMGGVLEAQDKEMQALQQLALMGAQYKIDAQKNLQQAQNQMGQLQDQAFEYNVNQPYQIKLNMAAEKAGIGQQNMWAGLTDVGNTVNNFLGTKYYVDAMEKMQGITGNDKIGKVTFNPNQSFSTPLGGARQLGTNQSLVNSASGLIPQLNTPTQYDWLQSALKKQGYTNG